MFALLGTKRQNKSFSPVFLSLWSFTSETFLKAMFSLSEVFLLSCHLFLLYLNQKRMAYQNCLKSLGACVAEHAAKIAIETEEVKLTDDKDFRQ